MGWFWLKLVALGTVGYILLDVNVSVFCVGETWWSDSKRVELCTSNDSSVRRLNADLKMSFRYTWYKEHGD